ncbi:unnamed protein product [Calypogeia fissa]
MSEQFRVGSKFNTDHARGSRAFCDRGAKAMAPPEREMGFAMPKTPSLKYWDDCADPKDIQALWAHPAVRNEWIAAGEKPGQKVHLSRAFEGQPHITEVEMRAIAEIILDRHFSKLDPIMVSAVAEIESSRNPLASRWDEELQESSVGVMQVLESTADWLAKDIGYKAYAVDWTPSMLYRPFVSVYFGAAYLKWLSTYEGKRRSEEFIVRRYSGGPKSAGSKKTLDYWNKYLIAKQNIQMKSHHEAPSGGTQKEKPSARNKPASAPSEALASDIAKEKNRPKKKNEWTYWEEKCSKEDVDSMWNHPAVKKQWLSCGEQKGEVRFSRDPKLRPVVTETELKAIAENITTRFFPNKGMSPAMLCAIAEISSNRLVNGLEGQGGIMGLSFETAMWLYREMGYKSYRLKVHEDLSKPFVCMYFGAAYVCWLSNHNNRPRSDEFVVRAYKSGVKAVDDDSNESPSKAFWIRYLEVQGFYRSDRNGKSTCCIQ